MALLTLQMAVAFAPRALPSSLGSPMITRVTGTQMMAEMITVGQPVPDVDVEVTTANLPGEVELQKLTSALGPGLSVLVGMPGAFTPTCNDLHLPSYYNSVGSFAALGANSINVLTINDKWVNAAWQKEREQCIFGGENTALEIPVQMLADPRGDLLEAMGMIAYLGKELGIRSKRFAMLVEDGVVRHVTVDKGSVAFEETPADMLLSSPFMEGRRKAVAAAAEQYVAGELALATCAVDALAYLNSDETKAFVRARFISDDVLEKATIIVEAAAAKEDARSAAEYAVSAALFPLGPKEAYKYLASPSTLAMLRKADVPAGTIDASLKVVLDAAVAADPDFKPGKVAVPAAASGSDGGNPGAVIGGLVVALAAAGAVYAQQQGLFDAGDVSAAASALSSSL